LAHVLSTNIVDRNCRTERERGHPDLPSA